MDEVQNYEPLRETVDLQPALDKINALSAECSKVLVGQKELIDLFVICTLADGHVLLEGVPGIAKTLSAKVLAKTLQADFSRIQFTPDLMPSDILGTSVFNLKTSEFVFKKGPVFSNLILIDEINRAPAKTQAALFEIMEERQVTFDGDTYFLDFPFLVIATQNPIEQEGTYRLPEAQLDRFIMKIILDYPTFEDEIDILRRFKDQIHRVDLTHIQAIISKDNLKDLQILLSQIYVEDQILKYITEIIRETRQHAKLYLGASPRAALHVLKTSKAAALLSGRDFVIPDDIQFVAPHVLNHRLILSPLAELEGITTKTVITEILQRVEVPR